MQRCLFRNHLGMPYSAKRDQFVRGKLTNGFGDNVIDLGHLLNWELASALVQVDLSNLAGEVGEASADTLDDSEGERNLVLSVDVGVLHTKNVLKVISVLNNEACLYTKTTVRNTSNATAPINGDNWRRAYHDSFFSLAELKVLNNNNHPHTPFLKLAFSQLNLPFFV